MGALSQGFAYAAFFFAVLFTGLFSFGTQGSHDFAQLTAQQTKTQPVRVLFVGDMMFDRSVRQAADARGVDFIFSCASSTLRSYDVVVGNLEGPITDKPSVSIGSIVDTPENYTFTFAPAVAPALYAHNIRIVNLGNNHILNQGTEGLRKTRDYLTAAHVEYFGGVKGNSTVLRTALGGRQFSFVSFNEFGGEDATTTADLIRQERAQGRTVVLYAHWGDEYVPAPGRVVYWTRLFAEAGAAAIVGSHPHVVQAYGREEDVPYYYSLGNFVFDQYWEESVRTGLAVEMIFSDTSIVTREIPVRLMDDRTTCLLAQ